MKKDGKILSKLTKNGFYIILFLCICAIGISGYVMFYTPEVYEETEVLGDWGDSLELPLPEQNSIGYDFESAMSSEPLELPEETSEIEQENETDVEKEEPTVDTVPEKAVETAKEVEPEVISYVKAVDGEISLPYSGDELIKSKTFGDWRIHSGVDIAAPEGTKVCAIAAGTVTDVFEDEMMGYTVKIQHKSGCVSTYSNLMKGIVVAKGQKVKAGEVIGGIGTSALAECMETPHLHLELTDNNKNIDPMSVVE